MRGGGSRAGQQAGTVSRRRRDRYRRDQRLRWATVDESWEEDVDDEAPASR